jgi:hypothetical protein
MSKAIIVVDFAYKGPRRTGRGSGRQGLRATLRYLQFRDQRSDQLTRSHERERWHDRGMGRSHSEILRRCDALQSRHVLAWTWVISPAPDLMALVPPRDRRPLLCALTERVVEDYYSERDLDLPEYSYVLHSAATRPTDDAPPLQHLHTHVILPGTAPADGARTPVYNNASKGHDRLFREIASQHFADILDERGIDWRRLRDVGQPARDELFAR